jgi:hypothetical protein
MKPRSQSVKQAKWFGMMNIATMKMGTRTKKTRKRRRRRRRMKRKTEMHPTMPLNKR